MSKVVLANGCFDILHAGHIEHLKEARSLGDKLVVSLTKDDDVNKGAGRPVNKWKDRATVLRALRFVNKVIPSRSCVDAIRKVKPDIFVKGVDYLDSELLDAARSACDEVGAIIHITKTPKFSSSEIIERIKSLPRS